MVPDWIWYAFIFAFGSCVGSFLNVVIYRLPRDKSLVFPPSACPSCGRHIHFYDNIPLISWLILGAKCRYCKAPISPRYFVIELLTALLFAGTFFLFFRTNLRAGVAPFAGGGWFIYLMTLILLSALLAASAIDLELWIIPLSICWFVTGAGLIGSAVGQFVINPSAIRGYGLLPVASAGTGAFAVGAAIGTGVSLLLLVTGCIKRSYEWEAETTASAGAENTADSEVQINHRMEVGKEIIFLLPIIVCAVGSYLLCLKVDTVRTWWVDFSQQAVIAGLLGSLWGYFAGCGVVWATRILGTLAFGKEAMGLGDVHLMGAAGSVIGAGLTVVAFFIAPFFGLVWAAWQMFFKKTRQIPYGPFLSMGIVVVIILHDWILNYWSFLRYQ
jgi:leader peptidase (prepilin peptidase)/N-methyltransferase